MEVSILTKKIDVKVPKAKEPKLSDDEQEALEALKENLKLEWLPRQLKGGDLADSAKSVFVYLENNDSIKIDSGKQKQLTVRAMKEVVAEHK